MDKSEAGHTAGPWELIWWGNEKYPYPLSIVTETAWVTRDGAVSSEANARLIAASPDLLDIALRWAALDAGAWHVERHLQEKARLLADTRAAIAKARTGGQS